MSPEQLLETAALLGVFVLLAGGYGALYGLGQLRAQPALIVAGFATYVVQCGTMAVLLLDTPLLGWWKAFLAVSCALYLAIPPLTWRYLNRLHNEPGP